LSTLKDQIAYCQECLDKGGRDHQQMRAIKTSLILIDKLNLIPPKIDGADYQEFVRIYFDFRRNRGAEPKMSGAAGKALKEIIVYLMKMEKINGDVKKALEAWEYVLSRWNDLSDFVRQQVGLTMINKHIEEILEQLRNGRGNRKGAKSANQNATNDLASAIIQQKRGGGG